MVSNQQRLERARLTSISFKRTDRKFPILLLQTNRSTCISFCINSLDRLKGTMLARNHGVFASEIYNMSPGFNMCQSIQWWTQPFHATPASLFTKLRPLFTRAMILGPHLSLRSWGNGRALQLTFGKVETTQYDSKLGVYNPNIVLLLMYTVNK